MEAFLHSIKVKFKKKKDTPRQPLLNEESEWNDDEHLCPECEGRGYVWFKDKRDIAVWGEKELCLTCDGLGVVYEGR